ncbi:MAG: Ig-like domain-containing protein [bacterium]|nr:Ig-like domain-containing protein [bacterium]
MVQGKRFAVLFVFCACALFSVDALRAQAGRGGDKNRPERRTRVVVMPADTTLAVGDVAAFSAHLVDINGIRTDTTFQWSVTERIGSISEDGVFLASRAGSGMVVASIGKLSGTAGIRVTEPDWRQRWRVQIIPNDTVVIVGQGIQFHARLVNREGATRDTAFVWEVSNRRIGNVDRETGSFTALRSGPVTVSASIGRLIGRARVSVRLDSAGWAARRDGLRVTVEPRDAVTVVGRNIQFHAALLDSQGTVIDTPFVWSLEGGDFGTVDEEGLFTAEARGHGFVYASAGTLSGKAHISVLADTAQIDSIGDRDRWRNRLRLVIEPRDTLLLSGQTVQYRAYFVDTTGVKTGTDVRWRLLGRRVGTMDEAGLFTAQRRGVGIIKATKERYAATARVMVAKAAHDTTGSDSIRVRFKDREGRDMGETHRLGEKDVLKLSGLPFPLNVLNGGEIAFPPGCLTGDISIDISLPEGTDTESDSVLFPQGILTGASFTVLVDGEPVDTFPFDEPVQVSFPLKNGLLRNLGLLPEDLGAFFLTGGGDFDTTGISDVVVDTSGQTVYASAGHFSTVVFAKKSTVPSAVDVRAVGPAVHRLHTAYPNPFNPETTIRFEVAGSLPRKAAVTVFDVTGRRVAVLFSGSCLPGLHEVRWNGRDGSGSAVGSGLYIVRFEAGNFSQSRRVVLLK